MKILWTACVTLSKWPLCRMQEATSLICLRLRLHRLRTMWSVRHADDASTRQQQNDTSRSVKVSGLNLNHWGGRYSHYKSCRQWESCRIALKALLTKSEPGNTLFRSLCYLAENVSSHALEVFLLDQKKNKKQSDINHDINHDKVSYNF